MLSHLAHAELELYLLTSAPNVLEEGTTILYTINLMAGFSSKLILWNSVQRRGNLGI